MLLSALLLPALLAALAGAVPARSPPPPPPGQSAADGALPADILCSAFGGGPHCKGSPEPAPATPGRGRRQAQAATADEQQQQQCAIFGGAACGPARDKRQEQAEQGAEIDPEQLCGIFAGPTCTSEQQNKVYDPCTCPAGSGDGCECVPYYNCDGDTGNYNTDGVGVIDIRQKQDREGYDASAPNSTCSHYLQQCCRVREGQGPAPGPAPGPDPGPDPGPVTDEPWTQPQRPPPGPGPQPLKKPKCGVRHKNGIGDRISGALHDETNYGEIPWMVAIFKKRQAEHDYVCGGGLIAPNVVMTAAHCVNEKTPSNLKIRAGEWDSRTTDERYPHQDRDVAEIITHPDYKPQALHNDVALLVLREPVRLSRHIGTLCLPDQGQNFDHRTCLVSGWGKDVFGKEGVYQNIMRRIDDLPVVPYAQCQEKLRRTRVGPYFRLNKSFMCAGGVKGRDACTGDGGSPLACPITDSENTRYKFAGIVSWGVGCGEEDVPGVYADVAQFRSWIDDQLATRGIPLPRADDGDD